MTTTDEDQFTLSVETLQRITSLSRTSLWRRLQNAPCVYRRFIPSESARKYYRLSDAIIALRWATIGKTSLVDAEQELVEFDAHMRKQGYIK